VACGLFPAGNHAGYKEKIMTHRSLAKSLAVRSDRGHVVTPAPAFSTGFLQQKADGLAPVSDTAVIEAALSILAKRIARGSVMSSPPAVKEFLTLRLSDLQHEIFGVMLLTTRHTLIDFVELFRGTLDGASVHPRELVKLALAKNAAALIITHSHPSGVREPSRADELITTRIKEALALVEIRCLDHLLGGF
jgi:DNA repair protein RadC